MYPCPINHWLEYTTLMLKKGIGSDAVSHFRILNILNALFGRDPENRIAAEVKILPAGMFQ